MLELKDQGSQETIYRRLPHLHATSWNPRAPDMRSPEIQEEEGTRWQAVQKGTEIHQTEQPNQGWEVNWGRETRFLVPHSSPRLEVNRALLSGHCLRPLITIPFGHNLEDRTQKIMRVPNKSGGMGSEDGPNATQKGRDANVLGINPKRSVASSVQTPCLRYEGYEEKDMKKRIWTNGKLPSPVNSKVVMMLVGP